MITDNRQQLEMVVDRLLEVETMDGRDVDDLVKQGRILTEDERKAREPQTEEQAKPAESPVGPCEAQSPVPPLP